MKRAQLAAVIGGACISFFLAGTAIAQVINACVNTTNGQLRVVASGTACKNGESPLQWNAEGIQGPQGPKGETGSQGEQGPPGPSGSEHVGAIYRWAVWNTYSQYSEQAQLIGWYANNDPSLFGGVSPANWGDGSAAAAQMSADKEVLRTLFTRKGYGGKNATVVADEWFSYSSTNSGHAAALFRIENTTASAIPWTVTAYMTSYLGWSERASVALNGTQMWASSGTTTPNDQQVITLPIRPGLNTVIFVSSSAPGRNVFFNVGIRSLFLAFSNDSLVLPAGLNYVDDLDVAVGGWEQ